MNKRLLEERKRLGLSQEKMAELGGVPKRTYCDYEYGISEPKASFFEKLAAGGVDILYIVTGIRNKPAEIKETPANYTVLAKKRLQNIAEELPEDDLADLVKLAEDKKQKNDYRNEIEELKKNRG